MDGDIEELRAAELRARTAELDRVREERAAAQKLAAELPGLRLAAARVERDRSAKSSPKLDELRARVQDRHDELVARWDQLDRLRHMEAVLATRVVLDRSAFGEASAAEYALRRSAAAAADEAGVHLAVPLPSPVAGNSDRDGGS